MKSDIFFSVDAKTILHLGRNSIKDAKTAIVELVKNSYDADASVVKIDIFSKKNGNTIKITDNGTGMTLDEIKNKWMRIGFSSKGYEPISKRGRRKTGEKGIGRIATDRLGKQATLVTKAKEDGIYELKVDWDKFEFENASISDVPIELSELESADLKQGTQINIEVLRDDWDEAKVSELYDELSIITPPFRNVDDFNIEMFTDITEKYNGTIKSPFYELSEITLEAIYDDKSNSVTCEIKDKYGNKQEIVTKWPQLSLRVFDPATNNYSPESLSCGSVAITLLFYRRQASLVEGTSFSLNDLKEFLDKNTGIKIYRDNIRVKPYGDPKGGDWLDLSGRKAKNPAAINRKDWRVASHQVVGAIYIGRDSNPEIIDSSAREGFIDNKSFFDLRALVLGAMSLLETYRFELNQKLPDTQQNKDGSTLEKLQEVQQTLEKSKTDILDKLKLDEKVESQDEVKSKIESTLEYVNEEIKSAVDLAKADHDREVIMRALATIGISTAVFAHEIQSTISALKQSIVLAKDWLMASNKTDTVLKKLESAIYSGDKISMWGDFTLARIKKDKRIRKRINLKKLAENLINELETHFGKYHIVITTNLDDVSLNAYTMDIESLFLNLITNSFNACINNSGKERKIHIDVKHDKIGNQVIIAVSDSGHGIANQHMDIIWEPLFTTKKNKRGEEDGTGLGLFIVKSIVEDMNGQYSVSNDESLGGAKFNFVIPI
ncbi:sensor histidine kinase [Candidatus Dojkabacteria bacterium]|nr:sensor histidine kinase [Candidatus Dojkabacteria bacterium]